MDLDGILSEQIAYYRRRAPEYDETSYGDVEAVRPRVDRIVRSIAPSGRVLELACGTGVWTRALAAAPAVDDLTAMDASPEAVAVARDRCPSSVRFEVGDVFAWEPDARVDLVFFSAWLSHVPTARVPDFFARVGSWLAPGGRMVFVDEPASQAEKEHAAREGAEVVRRSLRDGSEHRLVKIYLDPVALAARLGDLGWSAEVILDGEDWLVGTATLKA